MIAKIANSIKKNKLLYNIIKKTMWPIYTGYLFYMIKYIIIIHNPEIKLLKSFNIKNIKIYNSKNWRIGKNKDHVFRRYYTGIYNKEKCFIKIATNDLTTKNELKIQNEISKYDLSFVPKVYITNDKIKKNTVLIVNEYINDLRQINEISNSKEANLICNNFLNILMELEKIKLVHADINKGNLMIDKHNNIKLLDFGISKFKHINNDINYLQRPGTFYTENENKRTYDDAFSFIKLLDKLGIKNLFKNLESYKTIEKRIGKINFTVDMLKYK